MTLSAMNNGRSFADPMQDLGAGLFAFGDQGLMKLYVLTHALPALDAALTFDDFWKDGVGWCLFTPADLSKVDVETWTKTARKELPAIDSSHGNRNAFVWLQSANDFDTELAMWWAPIQARNGTGGSTATFECDRISVAFSKTTAIGGVYFTLIDKAADEPAYMTLVCEPSNVSINVDGITQVVGFAWNPAPQGGDAWVCQIAFDGPQAGSLAMPLGLDIGTLADQFGLETSFQYALSQIADTSQPSAELQTVRMPLFSPQSLAPTDQNQLCAFNVLLNPCLPFEPALSGVRIDRAGRILSKADPASAPQQAKQVDNARALLSPFAAAADGAVITLTPADPLEEKLAFDAYIGGGFAFCPQGPAPHDKVPSTPLTPAGVFSPSTQNGAAIDMMPGLFGLDFVRLAAGDRIEFHTQQDAYIPPPDSDPITTGLKTSYVSVCKGAAAEGRGYFGQSSTANLYLPDDTAATGLLSAALPKLSPLTTSPPFPMMFVGALFLEHPDTGPINPGLTADIVSRLDRMALGPQRHRFLLDAPDGPELQMPTHVSDFMRAAAKQTHAVITPQGYIVDVDAKGIFTDITLGVGAGDVATRLALRFEGSIDPVDTPKKVAPEVSTLLTRENLFLVATKVGKNWHFQNRINVAGFNFTVALDGGEGGVAAGTKPSILIIKLDARTSLREMALDPTSWTQGGLYVDDVQGVITRLKDLFEQAKADHNKPSEDPFGAFRKLLDDKSWTGVIAFDAPIDGNGDAT